MSTELVGKLRQIADQIADENGCYIYDLEFVGASHGRVLRVFIDKDAEGGASIDDCSNISRAFNQILDADENLIPGAAYDLEVSTPGLERVLKEPRHYQGAIGKKINVKTFVPLLDFNSEVPELAKAKTAQGKLVSYDDKGLRMTFNPNNSTEDGPEIFVPYDQITKAHVVFEFVEEEKGKKGAPNKKPHPKAKSQAGEPNDADK